MSFLDQYGEFAKIAPGLATLNDLQMMTNWDDSKLVWIMPLDLLAGVTRCYGIEVIRADVKEPIIGIKGTT